MSYEFISAREFDTTPKQYEQYLRDTYANAKETFAKPVQNWPRGTSHEIARAIMSECEAAICDLRLEFGLFDPHTFKCVGLADA